MFIYAGNLSVETNQQDLLTQFEQFGSVTSINILTDEISGNPLGLAFVEMPNDDEALRAISALDRTRIRDRVVMVCETTERLERRRSPRNRSVRNQPAAVNSAPERKSSY